MQQQVRTRGILLGKMKLPGSAHQPSCPAYQAPWETNTPSCKPARLLLPVEPLGSGGTFSTGLLKAKLSVCEVVGDITERHLPLALSPAPASIR